VQLSQLDYLRPIVRAIVKDFLSCDPQLVEG
jgi:hypothetical protein